METAGWLDVATRQLARQAPPGLTPLALALLLAGALMLAVPPRVWRYFGVYVTVVHELGHAAAALLTGQRLTGIRIRLNQSGTTHTLARGRWPAVWSAFWGYPFPAVLGAALVTAATTGWQGPALLAGSAVVVLTLLFIRNWFGVLAVLVCAVASLALLLLCPAGVQGYVLVALGAALLVGAFRAWVNVVGVHARRRSELPSSDAYWLWRRTGVPAAVWLLLMGAVLAVSGWAAGVALLGALQT
jgi:hypothetical protein